jgi:hypothetical protein
MATLRQYFETDFGGLLSSPRSFRLNDGTNNLDVDVSLHYDFDANAKFLSCFVPKSERPISVCAALLETSSQLLSLRDGVEVQSGFGGERLMSSGSLGSCGRVFLYTEDDIPATELERLSHEAEAKGLSIQIRGPRFAAERSRLERPVAFISHDSRDKDEIARPIAIELSKLMCPVWYDEYSLRLGDPLRESIEKGLKECKRCILILSKHFLANRGWTKTEFNVVFTRELLEETHLVLPIWCGIGKNDLYDYSPALLNRVGVKWDRGLQEVVRQIHRSID